MTNPVYRQVVELVLEAAKLARTAGIENILQPGLVKEMIMADILGHQVILTKRDADACDSEDSSILYEYLSCKEGGSGQFDRMFKEPAQKRLESLNRIRRNSKVYFAVFYSQEQTKVKSIYELEINDVVSETERQLDRSSNAISHVGFGEPWVQRTGRVIYQDPDLGTMT